MVQWVGIEDIGLVPTPVWLSREKDTADDWKPLRKADCRALNDAIQKYKDITTTTTNSNNLSASPNTTVFVESGRATADFQSKTLRYNYYSKPQQQLLSATWFLRRPTGEHHPDTSSTSGSPNVVLPTQPFTLVPLDNDEQTAAAEALYQQAVTATSSLECGIEESGILKEQVLISKDHYISIQRAEDHNGQRSYVFRKSPSQFWFGGKSYDLQRGYGPYKIEGEEEEMLLGPVRNVIFVIHGIGETMWSKENLSFAGSLIQEVTNCRLKMQKQQVTEWKQKCERAKQREESSMSPPPNRVELIPIFWYDSVHSTSSALIKSLQSTTLTTIPALREIANDVILDVLLYLTPTFCANVLECVTNQITEKYKVFCVANPTFQADGGKCSLMGHSLGSVICWDLLATLQDHKDAKEREEKKQRMSSKSLATADCSVSSEQSATTVDSAFQNFASISLGVGQKGSVGPPLTHPMERVLPFEPMHTIFLGSPLGLFLSIRGAHPIFDSLRDNLPDGPGKSRASPFRLPSSCIHNIFHPSDPVAYRIEPLLLPQGSQDIPPPLYLTREGESVRLHIKAMQLGDKIRKSFLEKRNTLTSFMKVATDQAQTLFTQLDDEQKKQRALQDASGKASVNTDQSDMPLRFPLAGGNGRLDYQLQPNVIDNEYVSAVLAHSSYFSNADVIAYIIDLTSSSKHNLQPTVIDLTGDENMIVML